MNCLKIGIGSGSAIKQKAVQLAFPESSEIQCFTFPSNVPEQPVGRKQTQQGIF